MYNPYRGRDTYTRQSDGGTRYARLPPVIEIIPLSGYLLRTLTHFLLAMLALLGLCYPRYYRERGDATPEGLHLDNRGLARRQPSATRGQMTTPTHYPEARRCYPGGVAP